MSSCPSRAPLAHVGRQAAEDATDILRVGLIVIDQVRQRQALHGTQAGFDRKLQFRFHARLVEAENTYVVYRTEIVEIDEAAAIPAVR